MTEILTNLPSAAVTITASISQEEAASPATVVTVLMPAALRARVDQMLATAGMRLYHLPLKDDGLTYMVGVDISECRESGGPLTVDEVLLAYQGAVDEATEIKPGMTKARKPKKARS